MTIVTLTTDFGTGDYACGLLHGVIWNIYPEAKIIDLSHDVPRHDVLAGALLLARSCFYFSPGSVHVAVVDPGVGTSRRPVAAKMGNQYFVGPDNGVFSLVAHKALQANQPVSFYHLNNPAYWLPSVSNIFHGRDIFSPAAAHLAAGVPIDQMGSPISDPIHLDIPSPEVEDWGWVGQVIHIDHFGNLATNIHKDLLAGMGPVRIAVKDQVINRLSYAFGNSSSGELTALIDSAGALSICVANGSAAELLHVNVGERIEIYPVNND